MDEQFDKKLTNHIRGVFDNYEHPGAERGWEQLRKKYPAGQRQNKVAWLWWSSAAAIIILFLGIGLWYKNPVATNNTVAVKPAAKQQQPVPAGSRVKDTVPPDPTLPSRGTPEPMIAQKGLPVTRQPFVLPYSPVNQIEGNINTPSQIQQSTVQNSAVNTIAQTQRPVATKITSPSIDTQKINSVVTAQPQMAAVKQTVVSGNANELNAAVSTSAKKQRTLADMLAENSPSQTVRKNGADKSSDKKVNFSVYAATYFNYAEGSSNQVNAGAGFTSDFKISKKLKLSTGVALAQNSLSYNTSAPQAANSLMAAAPALKQQTVFATSAVLPVFKNYNASLVGLDIPINLKYEFSPEKTDAYVSAGLSSGTFIDENYTYRYTYGNGATVPENTAQQQTAHNSFNNFYFGKMLNLSFGVGYPVGGNRLIVEPFVKYPLGGLGAQDIRFGSGGVNLKFSFKGRK